MADVENLRKKGGNTPLVKFKEYCNWLKVYKSVSENWLSVCFRLSIHRFPVTVRLRNFGHRKKLKIVLRSHSSWDPLVFISGAYEFLEVRNRVVLDVGAAIGDTAIHFVGRGADKVFAVEPYPGTCKVLQENIALNGLQDSVQVINAGLSDKSGSGSIKMGAGQTGDVFSEVSRQSPNRGEIQVPLLSLSYIVTAYSLDNALLKMDCEGCEYRAPIGSDISTLRRFERMCIEYHCGSEKLVTKLREAGFDVSVVGGANIGYIYATRR